MEGAGAPRERRCWPRAGTPHGDLLQRPGARAMGPCRTPTVSHTHLASCSQHETEPAGGDAGDVAGGRRERGEGGGSGAGKRHSTPPTHPPTHTTPHSSPTTGAALLALVLALALYNWPGRGAGELSSCNCAGLSGGSAAGDTAAPEGEGGTIAVSCCSSMSVKRVPPYRAGSINATFGVTHDWRGRARAVRAAGGMVAADHGRCSEEGAKVLGLGGNAVDAAITTALCQGVYNPMASGVGGGHFMLIRCAGRGNGLARSLEIAAAPRAAPFPPTHPAPPPGQAAQRHCRGDRCARGGPRQGQRDNVCWCDEFSCWLARSRGGRGAMHARAARSLHLHRAARRLGDRRAGGGGAARAQVRGCTRARAAGGMAASSPPPPPPPRAAQGHVAGARAARAADLAAPHLCELVGGGRVRASSSSVLDHDLAALLHPLQPAIDAAEQGFAAHPYLVATLGGEEQVAALSRFPALRDTFLIREGGWGSAGRLLLASSAWSHPVGTRPPALSLAGKRWRAPRVNETCCQRPALANFLREGVRGACSRGGGRGGVAGARVGCDTHPRASHCHAQWRSVALTCCTCPPLGMTTRTRTSLWQRCRQQVGRERAWGGGGGGGLTAGTG